MGNALVSDENRSDTAVRTFLALGLALATSLAFVGCHKADNAADTGGIGSTTPADTGATTTESPTAPVDANTQAESNP